MPEFLEVNPLILRLPPSRIWGADPEKLHRQIAHFKRSTNGMPPILVVRGADGELKIINGATRATRIAKLAPGVLVPIEVIKTTRVNYGHLPTIEEKLP